MKMKKCKYWAGYFGTIRDFLQREAIGTSLDVSWSFVAQAVPENKLFLSKCQSSGIATRDTIGSSN